APVALDTAASDPGPARTWRQMVSASEQQRRRCHDAYERPAVAHERAAQAHLRAVACFKGATCQSALSKHQVAAEVAMRFAVESPRIAERQLTPPMGDCEASSTPGLPGGCGPDVGVAPARWASGEWPGRRCGECAQRGGVGSVPLYCRTHGGVAGVGPDAGS